MAKITIFAFRDSEFLRTFGITPAITLIIYTTRWVSSIHIAEVFVHVQKCCMFPTCVCLSDDAVNRWCRIATPVKQAAYKRMRMATFWLPILLKPDKSSDSFTWALKVGLVASG